ncbi:MAG: hypothetical protein AAF438_07715 [Pseudomonadota bacterium]
MDDQWKTNKRALEICDEALEIEPQGRAKFVERVCGSDKALKDSVDELLQAIEDSGRFMKLDQEGSG